MEETEKNKIVIKKYEKEPKEKPGKIKPNSKNRKNGKLENPKIENSKSVFFGISECFLKQCISLPLTTPFW